MRLRIARSPRFPSRQPGGSAGSGVSCPCSVLYGSRGASGFAVLGQKDESWKVPRAGALRLGCRVSGTTGFGDVTASFRCPCSAGHEPEPRELSALNQSA